MVARCPECGLGVTHPQPLFTADDYRDGSGGYLAHFTRRPRLYEAEAERFCQFIVDSSNLRQGEFLEVGCGAGFLLANAAARGFNGLGIEVDRNSFELCRARGVRVRSEDFLDFAACHQGQFDIVALSHVLEHVRAPISWLKSIHRVLRPGGYVALAQPNHEGLVPRLFGRRWYAWDLARHFWHFTPMTLSRLLREMGFVDGDIKLLSMPHRVPFDQWADPKLFAVAAACYLAGRIGLLSGNGDQFFLSARKP
jgi:SAM-dependent methyltransferase